MEDFKESRRKGIGGSDIGPILGISPYKTPYQVYMEKAEGVEIDISNNEPVIWGNLLEDVIAKRYEEVTNTKTMKIGTLQHNVYPFLIANTDRIITSKNGEPCLYEGLEIKTVGAHSRHLWGDSGSQIIPENYYAQIAHYMLVCDVNIWHVAALIGGQELRTYTFERDKEFDEIIIEAGNRFWKEHVEKRIPPAIDYSNSGIKEFIRKRYTLVSQEIVSMPDNFLAWKDSFLECKQKAKYWQEKTSEAQAVILEQMKDAGIAIFSDGSSFARKLIRAKEYTVEAREYIRLDFKERRGEQAC